MPQMYGAWRPPKPQPCHTLQNYILQSLGVSVTTAVPHCCALECVASFTRGTYIAHRKWNCLIVMQVWKRANGGHKPPTLFTPSSPCHQLRPLLPLRAQLPHEVIRLLACPRRHPPAHLPHHRPEAEGVCRRRRPRLQQLRRGREAAPADSHRGGGGLHNTPPLLADWKDQRVTQPARKIVLAPLGLINDTKPLFLGASGVAPQNWQEAAQEPNKKGRAEKK